MAARFIKSANMLRGDIIYSYNYQKCDDGFRVSSLCYHNTASGKDPIRKKINIAAPFRNVEAMRQRMERYIDKHYASHFGSPADARNTLSFGEFFHGVQASIFEAERWKAGFESTRHKYRNEIENQIAPKLGGKPMRDITAADCYEVVKECEQEYIALGNAGGYTSPRAEHLLALMSTVFDHARARGVISKNPLENVLGKDRSRQLINQVKSLRLKPNTKH